VLVDIFLREPKLKKLRPLSEQLCSRLSFGRKNDYSNVGTLASFRVRAKLHNGVEAH